MLSTGVSHGAATRHGIFVESVDTCLTLGLFGEGTGYLGVLARGTTGVLGTKVNGVTTRDDIFE